MTVLGVAGRAVELLVVGVVVALVLGSVLGQPVLLSYVETGSMEPTLAPGDGIVTVPSAIAGPVEPGDVVIFRAERLDGGGLVTHRVVAETDRGFTTKGDANPFTDQESTAREPPVSRHQVVATVLSVDGRVVVVPRLGSVVIGLQAALADVGRRLASALGVGPILGPAGFAYLVAVLGLLLYGASTSGRGGTSDRPRDRQHPRRDGLDVGRVILAMAAVLVVASTASMVVPGGPQPYAIVSADNDAPGPRVIQRGTVETTTYPVVNGGFVPVVAFLAPDGDGLDVRPREVRVGARERVNATVTLAAPPDRGYYRFFLVEHRYLAVLPLPAIRAMHSIHPWVPIVVIDALVTGALVAVAVPLLGTGRRRVSARRRRLPAATRLRRLLP